MLKYYRTVMPKLSICYFIFMFAASTIAPIACILSKSENQFIFSTSIFFNYFICTLSVLIFSPTGASPSSRRSLETLNLVRNSAGGSSGCYDMTCLLPVKRKDYVKYSLYILLADTAVQSLIIILTVFSDNVPPQTSSFLSIAYLMIMIPLPSTLVILKKSLNIAASVLVITAFFIAVAFMIIQLSDNIDIIPVIPAGARIGIVIFTSVYLLVSGYFCVFRGEYARNGERIRN